MSTKEKPSFKKLISIIFLDIDGVLTLNEEEDDRILPILLSKGHESTDSISCLEYDQSILDLFDPQAVKNLEQLIMQGESQLQNEIGIVLSSDWRLNRTVPFLQKLFSRFPFAFKIVDRTPQLYNASREEEIMYWLKDKSLIFLSNPSSPARKHASFRHHIVVNPSQLLNPYLPIDGHGGLSREEYDIYSFVIIDDHDSAFSNHFPDQFVHVRNGLLNEKDVEKAVSILKQSYTESPKAMETILTFEPGPYKICAEDYDLIENIL